MTDLLAAFAEFLPPVFWAWLCAFDPGLVPGYWAG